MSLNNVEGKTNKDIIKGLLEESGIQVEFDGNLQTSTMKKGFVLTRHMSHKDVFEEMVKMMGIKE